MQPRILRTGTIALALAGVFAAGCSKKTDNAANYTAAINSYYSDRPECLFNTEKKFPVQADSKDDSDTRQYDALVDQGLLTRTTDEKKKMIVLSKQVNNYDLSDKGRGAWKPDAQQPGYGNFCYGKRKVAQITSNTEAASTQPGAAINVNYTYTIGDVADWARATEIQVAYPNVKAKLDGAKSSSSTLVLTNTGWKVQGGDIVQ